MSNITYAPIAIVVNNQVQMLSADDVFKRIDNTIRLSRPMDIIAEDDKGATIQLEGVTEGYNDHGAVINMEYISGLISEHGIESLRFFVPELNGCAYWGTWSGSAKGYKATKHITASYESTGFMIRPLDLGYDDRPKCCFPWLQSYLKDTQGDMFGGQPQGIRSRLMAAGNEYRQTRNIGFTVLPNGTAMFQKASSGGSGDRVAPRRSASRFKFSGTRSVVHAAPVNPAQSQFEAMAAQYGGMENMMKILAGAKTPEPTSSKPSKSKPSKSGAKPTKKQVSKDLDNMDFGDDEI